MQRKIKEGTTEGGDKLKEGLATYGYIVGYFLYNGLLYLGISIAAAMVISNLNTRSSRLQNSRGHPDHHPCHFDDH